MHAFRTSLLAAAMMTAAFSVSGAQAHAVAAAGDHAGHDAPAGQGQHADHAKHTDHAQHVDRTAGTQAAERAQVRFADVMLTDQNGRSVDLEHDVVGDRIVVMDFVYTSCTTVCPVVSAIMAEVQVQLGARVGRDVRLVSLTVDPARDTPARLRDYARSHVAGSGWTWLTGTVFAINETLKGLGTWTPDFEDHPVVMMVGDGRTGEWTRFYGFADPRTLVAKIEELSAARAAVRGPSMTAARE